MAIALQPKYPIPDRSRQPLRQVKDEDGVIDVGWCDGVMSDGRSFRAEMWAQDGLSLLTFFFSTKGIGDLAEEKIKELVISEGLASFRPGATEHCDPRKFADDAGVELWSVKFVVGDEDSTFLSDSVPIFPYSKEGEPNTMFNPSAIKAAHRVP